MKERPILFSGPMVRAILNGRKTQTRRVVKRINPDYLAKYCEKGAKDWEANREAICRGRIDAPLRCPYGAAGERLWVRETWAEHDGQTVYRADHGEDVEVLTDTSKIGFKPSIHMHRHRCRILLEIVSVRVERLQDITDADSAAEGVPPTTALLGEDDIMVGEVREKQMGAKRYQCFKSGYPRARFTLLWNSINAKTRPWESNPWVWVVEFKRVEGGRD